MPPRRSTTMSPVMLVLSVRTFVCAPVREQGAAKEQVLLVPVGEAYSVTCVAACAGMVKPKLKIAPTQTIKMMVTKPSKRPMSVR